jgi:N-acetylmuramoyl-L-alanine amidase
MNLKLLKYSSILSIMMIIMYVFVTICFPFMFIEKAEASSIGEKDVFKGIGIAVLLIILSELGQSQEESNSGSYDPDIGHGKPEIYLSKDEENLFARLIYAESRGEPYRGMVAVGAVVLNRVRSSHFPNSIEQVIYQEGQFSPVANGQIHLNPNKYAYDAVEDVVHGADPSLGALYFYNPEKARTLWWLETRDQTVEIGGHVFAK